MNVKQLQAFLAVYQLGSFTRAADRMNLTQSAVSVLIKQIESNIGLALFERTTRKLHPTQAAHDAIADVERLLRDHEHLSAKFRGLADKTHGYVSLAMSAGLAAALGGVILRDFAMRYPGVKVRVHDVAPNQILPLVLDGEVEFGIGATELDRAEVSQEVLATDTVSAICLRSDQLARLSSLSWKDVAQLPTITTPRTEPLRSFIDSVLATHGQQFEPKYEVSFLNTALSMAASGIGIAVMPSNLVPHLQQPMLVSLPLEGPTVQRRLCLIKKAGTILSPAGRSFADIVKETLARQVSLHTRTT